MDRSLPGVAQAQRIDVLNSLARNRIWRFYNSNIIDFGLGCVKSMSLKCAWLSRSSGRRKDHAASVLVANS